MLGSRAIEIRPEGPEDRDAIRRVHELAFAPSTVDAAMGVLDPYGAPPEAWMAYRLPAYVPEARGLMSYAEAFWLVE